MRCALWFCRPLRAVPDKTAVLPTPRSRKANAPSEPLRRTFLPCKKVRSSGSHQIKIPPYWVVFLFGGREWIRTTEARCNRFTVCPLWPLGNSPIYGAGERNRTINLLITNQLLCQLSYASTLTPQLASLLKIVYSLEFRLSSSFFEISDFI